MRPFGHLLIAALYGWIALAVAVALPYAGDGVARPAALLVAAALFAGFVFLHSLVVRAGWARAVRRELGQLGADRDRLFAELFETREHLRQIQTQLKDGAPEAVLREEIKQVHTLLERLSDKLGASAEPDATAGSAPAAAPASAKTVGAAAPPDRRPRPPPGGRPGDRPLLRGVPTGDGGGVAASRLKVQGRAEIDHLGEPETVALVREALAEDRIEVALAPIVALPQRKARHQEAHGRLITGSGHFLMPDQYQALAEREGLIVPIDTFLLLRCLQLLRDGSRERAPRLLFVQVSTYSLGDADFMRQLIEFLSTNARLAAQLVLQVKMDDLRAALRDLRPQLGRLGDLGFRFAIDEAHDLARLDGDALASVHIRYVKVKAGVLLRERRDLSRPLVVSMVKRELDRAAIDLIVDDIADDATLLEVLDMPIDFGQGALFGEPAVSR